MNLGKLSRQYSTKERCRELLQKLRWPDGVRCPRCQHSTVSWLTTREKYECGKCLKTLTRYSQIQWASVVPTDPKS
jgi:DNA-directed RNA polymerase subunit RPC12/RpoP